ncbi:MAG: sterol desaturase family protein [Sandaracinaceae bacterium]|nr:sterol desaturase family protein [Sandaracinaceae bacterium]
MLRTYVLIGVTLAVDAALVGILAWAFSSPRFARYRIREGAAMAVPWKHRLQTMVVIGTLSLAVVLGVTHLLYERLLSDTAAPAWAIAAQAAAILLVYDFIYYFAHRGMHHKKVLRLVHGVHHRARNPSALESFYQHPAELFVGLSLLYLATFLVGRAVPVHSYAFVAAFFVYSTLNILVHSGLDSGSKLLFPIDFLSRKHHVHHMDDPGKNYSSLTPLPDLLFGTSG